MIDLDKINELLHFMKGAEPFSKTFAGLIETSEEWCPFQHEGGLDLPCYLLNPQVKGLLAWTAKYLTCCKYLGVRIYSVHHMSEMINTLQTPEKIGGYQDFNDLLDELAGEIDFTEPEVRDKLSRLHCHECVRLDEALVCSQSYCFYSSIVMAVSAVEYRIAELVRRSAPELYSRSFPRATLGQLIQLFQDDMYKGEEFRNAKELMPSKHKPLISLLNQYRVFSAHPSEEQVTPQIAEAILHLAFSFLTDPQTCPYDPDELFCASG
ncbi:MAG: hypothetical protein Q7R39_07800 [Dehalococcoidia bacterium]|nr:hypothetical protein [Dehalococcoidia bacterium]